MYLKESPVFECMSEYGFPIAILRDIRVQCVHYESFEQFKEQWQRRSRRFLMHEDSEIFVIATDSQLRTDEAIEAFHQLPYRKVCFTGSEKISYEEFIYTPGCKSGVTGDLTKYVDYKGTRVFEKYFDCIRWLNEDGL